MKILSATLSGINAWLVSTETTIGSGSGFRVTGLSEISTKESLVRIRETLRLEGLSVPSVLTTLTSERPLYGPPLDLPIALGIFLEKKEIQTTTLDGLLIAGELSLSGDLRPVRGALSFALLAKKMGLRGVLLPTESASLASEVGGIEVYHAGHFCEIAQALVHGAPLPRVKVAPKSGLEPDSLTAISDMVDLDGAHYKKALFAMEVAAAGGHNLLLIGPPGIGKHMLARRMPGILPPMTEQESLETTQIYSAVGLDTSGALIKARPFRAPHHSISQAALLGGGQTPRPGEISLAHNGVLYLDDLPEFQSAALSSLRSSIRDRCISVHRPFGAITFPSSFLLVASANPCPCGFRDSKQRYCICGEDTMKRYRNRLNQFRHYFDLCVEVPSPSLERIPPTWRETSSSVQNRVVEARKILQGSKRLPTDAKIQRVAQTIAVLRGKYQPDSTMVQEAEALTQGGFE